MIVVFLRSEMVCSYYRDRFPLSFLSPLQFFENNISGLILMEQTDRNVTIG